MRKIQYFIVGLLIGFATLFTYANLRPLTVTEKLKQVNLVSFLLEKEPVSSERTSLEKAISTAAGISSCTIKKQTASVIFYQHEISEQKVATLFDAYGYSVTEKVMASTSGGGCPVHAVAPVFTKFLTALDLRKK